MHIFLQAQMDHCIIWIIAPIYHFSGGYDFSENGEATLLDSRTMMPVRDQRLRFSQSDAEQICEIYNCESMGHMCMGGKWTCKERVKILKLHLSGSILTI